MSGEMQIVPAGRPFELPEGWVLEIRPRQNSSIADKYYYEPHTGRQFRSLLSIKRYLLGGEEEPTPQRKAPITHNEGTRRIVHNGKLWKLEELEAARQRNSMAVATLEDRVSSNLPDHWIVEEVPRRFKMRTDRSFIEPVTRRKFRSLPEVQRYLTGVDEFATKYKPLRMINATKPRRGSCCGKETLSAEDFDMFNPPEKITWILSSTSGQGNWIPFMESFQIPYHVKEQWQETFFLGMTGRKQQTTQQITMGKPD